MFAFKFLRGNDAVSIFYRAIVLPARVNSLPDTGAWVVAGTVMVCARRLNLRIATFHPISIELASWENPLLTRVFNLFRIVLNRIIRLKTFLDS
jgi:hypothetical protein